MDHQQTHLEPSDNQQNYADDFHSSGSLIRTDKDLVIKDFFTFNNIESVNKVGQKVARKQISTAYTALRTDYYVGGVQTTAITVTLPPIKFTDIGKIFEVKDESGTGATNTITIAANGTDTIEGASTKVIDTNYGSYKFISAGATWFLLSPSMTAAQKTRYIIYRIEDPAVALAVVSTKGGDFEIPFGGTITEVGAYVDTAGTTNATTIDILKNGVTIMSTNKISIDSGTKSSRSAGTPPGITTTTIAVADILNFNITAISTTPPKGLTIRIGVLTA